jgi:hypothetical protein
MHYLILLIWIGGAIQLLDALANLAVPQRIRSRENLKRISPIVRQVFWSHWFYIMFVLVIFSMMCFLFAADLAGGSSIGRFLSGALAVFWVLRVPIQLYWFDEGFRRQNRAADVCFVGSSMYLAVVFVLACMGWADERA